MILGDGMNFLLPNEPNPTDSLEWVKVSHRTDAEGCDKSMIINTQEVTVSFLMLKGHVQCG